MTKRSDAHCEAIWRIMSDRLAAGQRPLALRELAPAVGMSHSGCYATLQRLVRLGYVVRPRERGGKYTVRVPLFPLVRDGADVLTPIPGLAQPERSKP